MPIKCESCRHFGTDIIKRQIFVNGRPTGQHVNDKPTRYCKNFAVTTDEIDEMFPARHGMPIDMAREICDREGDGIFVYFEPKEPSAGAAFLPETGAIATGLLSDEPTTFVQITREKKECSCHVGTCRGPEGLGHNYQCVLARPAAMTATGGAQ